jgi:hypothetical protein
MRAIKISGVAACATAALPVPVASSFRREAAFGYPVLGEDNALIGG